MNGGRVTLSEPEQRRLMVLNHLEAGSLSNQEAAVLLGLSVRQVQRKKLAYRQEGVAALAHGNRGRRPHHALDAELGRRVVELATGTYAGFNQQHLTEMLAEKEGISLSRSSVHRILRAAGVAAPRRRRPPRHRRRRDRFPRAGMLLQVDASRHDWLEGRGPMLTLVGGIDDATGLVPWACFRDREDAQGYFMVLRQIVHKHGIPLAIYSDRSSIFFHSREKELTMEEQLKGGAEPTQFGRLLKELGVRLILALSPQAKGRVERLWGTFQDRLASELRLAGATTLEEANSLLAGYLPRHNRRFVVAPQEPESSWMPWTLSRKPDEIFCFKYRRVVQNDNSVHFGETVIDIPPSRYRPTFARARVEVQERFDGTLCVYHQDHCIARHVLNRSPGDYRSKHNIGRAVEQAPPSRPKKENRPERTEPYRPASNHPWRSKKLAVG